MGTAQAIAAELRGRSADLPAGGVRPPADAGARAVFGPPARVALLAAFVLLAALRLPRAWVHGRFLDEEGTIFFAYAWHHPAWDALWRVFGGYLNIGAKAATLAAARLVQAGWLPLERAPYLTMAIALAVQAVPAALLLTGRGRWLARRWAVIAALLVLAVAPRTEEVFLNTLHIQFHLALGAALILALDVPHSRPARTVHGLILLLAPLCGPGAIILWPFFALRALVERSRARLVQTAALGAGAAAQMLLFFTPSPVRGHLLDPATLAAIMFVRLQVLPFVGTGAANRLGVVLHQSYAAHGAGWWLAVAAATGYFAWLVVLAVRRPAKPALWLIVPGLAVAAVSFGGGMIDSDSREYFSVGAGERYNFLPLVTVTLGLFALARQLRGWSSALCGGLAELTLVASAKGYTKPIAELADGPSWPAEVAAWRRDRDHPLATWPANWTIDLSDRTRPCTPPRPDGADTGDPSYCESHWLTRVIRATARDKARP